MCNWAGNYVGGTKELEKGLSSSIEKANYYRKRRLQTRGPYVEHLRRYLPTRSVRLLQSRT